MIIKKFLLTIAFFSLQFAFSQETEKLNITQTSIEKAIKLAQKENKKVFIDFYTDWCVNCKAFKAKTLKDKKVINSLNQNFITLEVDAEKQELSFVKQNKIDAYPTFLIIDPQGKIISKELGYMNAKTFLEFLKS